MPTTFFLMEIPILSTPFACCAVPSPTTKPKPGESGKCTVELRLWGAAGGGAVTTHPGGAGAFVHAKYNLKGTTQLYIHVGQGL